MFPDFTGNSGFIKILLSSLLHHGGDIYLRTWHNQSGLEEMRGIQKQELTKQHIENYKVPNSLINKLEGVAPPVTDHPTNMDSNLIEFSLDQLLSAPSYPYWVCPFHILFSAKTWHGHFPIQCRNFQSAQPLPSPLSFKCSNLER